jgi:hypothetical protein
VEAQMTDPKKASPTPATDFGPEVVPEHLRPSRDLIYEAMSRAGGDAFGAPFALGLASLTERVSTKLKQHGFFGFETLEQQQPQAQRNKFTRQGAAPFRGPYRRKPPR